MSPLSIAFDNSYARLPWQFYRACDPTPAPSPELIRFNIPLAKELGIDVSHLSDQQLATVFSGNQIPAGSEPLALAYAGHQFGHFVPQLGDGRAVLLGEVIDRNHRRRDVQLKGSGRTPFSRGGDGRAPLGPVIREYLVSEAMHALGVPTSRALAAVSTGEAVIREGAEPGAVLTRVANSHVRVGTFQYFAGHGDSDSVRQLADYSMSRHFPETMSEDNPYIELLRSVAFRQAELIAQWMSLGFIHGVMNTDNTTLSGETLDYGPCAFMDHYDPETVYSFVDAWGRYAYGNQPDISYWNLARFAESLLPLLDEDKPHAVEKAKAVLTEYNTLYASAWLERMAARIGINQPRESDRELLNELLAVLAKHRVDFTLFFRRLSHIAAEPEKDGPVAELFSDMSDWRSWREQWRLRLEQEPMATEQRQVSMLAVNPAIIPRNHRVEAAISAAEKGDLSLFNAMVEQLGTPFDSRHEDSTLAHPPAPGERVRQTFCGT